MIKAIIIDDEAKARRIMEVLLTEHCPTVTVMESAEDVLSGIKAIHKHQPDLVFLDIEMPGYTGFQLLDFFEEIRFQVVFTTAYSEYALQAFQVSAVDYLLKPIQIDQLVNAVEKVKKLIGSAHPSETIIALKENLEAHEVKKLAVPTSSGLAFIATEHIVLMEADGSYTHIYLTDGTKMLISKKIKEFELNLASNTSFFRTHRSYLINLAHLKQYVKQDGGHLLMDNNQIAHLARERKDAFHKRIEHLKL